MFSSLLLVALGLCEPFPVSVDCSNVLSAAVLSSLHGTETTLPHCDDLDGLSGSYVYTERQPHAAHLLLGYSSIARSLVATHLQDTRQQHTCTQLA